ncbi:helix-turn-helix domain-containing protein [Virgibacillus sp. SK37]|uniref:helix-turn-helix domain-containing protein n=1 Tax=Virgibacillus sp. SK37 TaxID=403957 RepID=UPI0004D1BA29|nr:helix-turn-helix transcriptional regulator [Virgibacillus sp. SK37]AIF42168.1 XRE family transcriptional regulator [Virgibacillus sp. SK37]
MNNKEKIMLVDQLVVDFGKTVKEFRIKSGLTLQDMAEIVSLSPSYVYRIEAHKRKPEIGTRIRFMTEAMGFTSEEINLYLEKYIAKEKINRESE